jgi:hypothetical protein
LAKNGDLDLAVDNPSPVVPAHITTGATMLNMVVVIGSLAKPMQVRSLPSGQR